MNKNNLYKKNYDKLDIEEKQKILNEIATHYGFTIKNYAEFEKNGISLYTAIFDDNGKEFVFIPGAKNISLGWKASVSAKKEDPELIDKIGDILLNYLLEAKFKTDLLDIDDVEKLLRYIDKDDYKQADAFLTKMVYKFIDDRTSFLRRVDVEPMLMERRSQSLNWAFEKEISSKEIADNSKYLKIYQEIVKDNRKFITKRRKVKSDYITHKYEITEHGLNVYVDKVIRYEEILFEFASNGYNLPTMNQWEYAAAAGVTSFFQVDDMFSDKHKSTTNAFGLYIADDIHKPEVITDNTTIFKSGDDGYLKHFVSKELALLSLNPFYNTSNTSLGFRYQNGLFVRKVISIDLNKQYKPTITKKNINKYITENLSEDNFVNIIYAVNSVGYDSISFKNILKIINIYIKKDFINTAKELVDKYMKDGQSNPEFLYLAGLTAFRLKDYEKSEVLLKRAVMMRRNMPECYQMLSFIYHNQNNVKEMEKALHNLNALAEDVAKSMAHILVLKGSVLSDVDYEDLWQQLVLSLAKKNTGKINTNTNVSEIILLDSTVQVIIHKGIENYIKFIKPTGSKYLMEIFEKIETSKYIKDETYLSKSDYIQAIDEFNACKNIIYEAENITDIKANKEYLQDLTNSFFDYFPALLTLAYIHYSNCRLFEAEKVFDENYAICANLYRAKELPIQIADNIRVLLEDFIASITMNILSYSQIQEYLDNIVEKTNRIKEKYSANKNQGFLAVDLSLTKDIKYILNWFNIEIDIKDAMRKNS